MDIWKCKDGSIPLLDDPSLKFIMFRWNRRPDLNLDVVRRRIETGQISALDLDIAVTLSQATLLTEKQLRHLYRQHFPQAHKLGTRLRILQQNGWLEAWKMESDFNEREYLWSVGISAKNFLGYSMGLADVPNPIHLASSIQEQLFYPAINEIRIRLLEKSVLEKDKFVFFPFLSPTIDSPHAVFQLNTPAGKMEFLVERLQQKSRPLRYMKMKLSQYRKYVAEHGALPTYFEDSVQSVLTWSVSTDEGIAALVGSYPHFDQEFMQLFIVDEHMQEIRTAWRFAQREEEHNVNLQLFDMDFIK